MRAARIFGACVPLFAVVARALLACGGDDSSGGSPTDDGGSQNDVTSPTPPDPPIDAGATDDGKRPTVPGLDPNFGNGGFANKNVLAGTDIGHVVLRQPDNKIIVVGYSDSTNDMILVRLDTAGALDPTYGTGGRVQIDVPHNVGRAGIVGVRAILTLDGKVLILATEANIGSAITGRLYRVDANGALDATFGTGGKLSVQANQMASMAVQPDGKIVVAGTFTQSFITRYTATGGTDTTFGNGTGTITFTAEQMSAVAIAPSGKIVVAGYEGNGTYLLRRWLADGTPDSSLKGTGRTTTALSAGAFPYAVAVQADEKMVLAGTGSYNSGLIVRYDNAGDLDTTFDTDGLLPLGTAQRAVVIDGTGRIVVASQSGVLQRVTSTGALDNTFTSPSLQQVGLRDLVLQPDGKVVAVGQGVAQGSAGMKVLRTSDTGALDPAFATAGIFTTAFAGSDEQASDAIVQPDGKILVASGGLLHRFTSNGANDATYGTNGTSAKISGTVTITNDATGRTIAAHGDGTSIKLVAVSAAGALDTSWGGNGTMDVGVLRYPRGMLTHANGSFYVTGSTSNGCAVAKVAADGKSSSYGVVAGSSCQTHAIVAQPDGKVITTGWAQNTGKYDLVVARLDENVALDPTFGAATDAGTNGVIKVKISNNDSVGRGIALQPDGKIVVTGTTGQGPLIADEWFGSSKIFVTRFLATGDVDSSFGTSGIAKPEIGSDATAYQVRVQADGKLLVAGRKWGTNGRYDAFLLRLNADGSIDTTHATNGIRVLAIGNESGMNTLALLPDGKAIATGYVHLGFGAEDIAVFQLIP